MFLHLTEFISWWNFKFEEQGGGNANPLDVQLHSADWFGSTLERLKDNFASYWLLKVNCTEFIAWIAQKSCIGNKFRIIS